MRKQFLISISIIIGSLFFTHSTFADVNVCPLEEAMRRLEDYNKMVSAKQAEQAMPILKEIQTINSKAKKPSLSIGMQLSKSDLARFQELREQLLEAQTQTIIESGYLRDSRVIAQAAKTAYDISQGRTFDEKDPEFFYYSIVMLLSAQHPASQTKVTTPNNNECTVNAGLYFNEQLSFREIGRLPFQEASAELQQIAGRYGLNPKQEGWINRIPSEEEKRTAEIDMGIVSKGLQMMDYINNMENLRALNRVSVLGYLSDKDDIRGAHTEAELSRIGTTWPQKVKQYDERTQILAEMLDLIEKKIPSDSAIETQGRTKMLQQQGVIK